MSAIEALLKRERFVVVGGLLLVALLAWIYTLAGVGMDMGALEITHQIGRSEADDGLNSASIVQWTLSHTGFMLAMWWIMMVAMMLPSAAPTVLLAAALNRHSTAERPPYGSAGFFTLGYLLAWLLFSAVAVAAQWVLQQSGQLSTVMQSNNTYLSAGLLIVAGLWQFSPIKNACLRHCRSPIGYLTRNRRPGNSGALLMGIGHGSYCLGCCWFLMALLFVGGVMNVYWIAGLALYVLIEKLLPYGRKTAQLAGVVLVVTGLLIGLF